MIKRLAIALVVMILAAASAFAQNNFQTPGNATANGAVNMCLNGSSLAVPCSAATPLPTSGSVALTSQYPSGAIPITASSAIVANAAAVATLAANATRTTYICGFKITSTGATAAAVVTPTITGTVTGTMNMTLAAVAGATLNNPELRESFATCIPGSAVNTAIVVTLPALGAGNTSAAAFAWGYQL